MSRNLRDKPRRPISRKTVVGADDSYDSSDDDYAGVDLISDSDEEEPDVEKVEEQAIIESEEEADDESDDDLMSTPRPQTDDDQHSWAGFELDDQPSLDEAPFFDEQMATSSYDLDEATEAAVWSALQTSEDEDSSATPRRVRFDLTDSSASFSDNEENIFPDIFLPQASLDPGFRRVLEKDDRDDDASSESGSYWDVNGSDDNAADTPEVQQGNHSDSSDESSGISSGYETDEGETTEEDLPPAAKFVPARSVLRRMSSESSASEEEVQVVRRRSIRPTKRSLPKLASWVHDASKPFAVIDSRGKRLIMFKARAKRSFSFSAGDTPTPRTRFGEDSDQEGVVEQLSPMISNSANLMMSAMFSASPFDNMLGGQVLGPPEAFYPFTSVSADGTVTQESVSSSLEDDDVDDEDLWNVEDFVDFGEGASSDDDENRDGDISASEAPSSTPLRPSTATSEDQVHPLLNHFQNGVVGAFRRNQTRHHLLSRNATTHDGLAFSNPYQHGPLRGIRGGRLEAVNVPITPMRRQKNNFHGLGSNAESPVSAAQKRKFSGETPSHKRTRSLM